MRVHSSFPCSPNAELVACLKSLGHFVYRPNPGNVGDVLIAVGTLQLFEQLGLSYESYRYDKDYRLADYTLVYGGGGGFVPHHGCLPIFMQIFSEPRLKRCVILPQSMAVSSECLELLDIMDERFTVFFRDRRSYEFACSHNARAHFFLADDMAFGTNPETFEDELHKKHLVPSRSCYLLARLCRMILPGILKDKAQKSIELYRHLQAKLFEIQDKMSACLQYLSDGRRVAWLLRADSEKATTITSRAAASFDLSCVSLCDWIIRDVDWAMVLLFLQAIDQADIIVSDRLHVSIGAAMLGKQVIMLDNNYGKLSGVWEQSMKQMPHVHLCASDDEFESVFQKVTQ